MLETRTQYDELEDKGPLTSLVRVLERLPKVTIRIPHVPLESVHIEKVKQKKPNPDLMARPSWASRVHGCGWLLPVLSNWHGGHMK